MGQRKRTAPHETGSGQEQKTSETTTSFESQELKRNLDKINNKDRRTYYTKGIKSGVNAFVPAFIEILQDEVNYSDEVSYSDEVTDSEDENIPDEESDYDYSGIDDYPEPDDPPDFIDMTGDEDQSAEVPSDGNCDETTEQLYSKPVRNNAHAEINEIQGRLYVSMGRIKGAKREVLRIIIQAIADENRDFILRRSDRPVKLEQKKISKQLGMGKDKSINHRIIESNYIAFPDGIIYPLSMFFFNIHEKKDATTDNLKHFMEEILNNEKSIVEKCTKEGKPVNKALLFSDSNIASEYYDRFNQKTSRRSIQRYREELGIKSIDERLKDY